MQGVVQDRVLDSPLRTSSISDGAIFVRLSQFESGQNKNEVHSKMIGHKYDHNGSPTIRKQIFSYVLAIWL